MVVNSAVKAHLISQGRFHKISECSSSCVIGFAIHLHLKLEGLENGIAHGCCREQGGFVPDGLASQVNILVKFSRTIEISEIEISLRVDQSRTHAG